MNDDDAMLLMMIVVMFRFLQVIGYKCNSGYFHSGGHLKRACRPNGKLTGKAPECARKYNIERRYSSITSNKYVCTDIAIALVTKNYVYSNNLCITGLLGGKRLASVFNYFVQMAPCTLDFGPLRGQAVSYKCALCRIVSLGSN